MKRIIFTSIVTLLLAGLLAGCGMPAGQGSPTASDAHSHTGQATATSAPEALASTPATSAGRPNVIKIVSSLPDVPDSRAGQDAVAAIRQRLAEANYQACDGQITIEYESKISWDEETGYWNAEHENRNAIEAASDPDVMAFIGGFYSGAAKVSIPLLNRAGVLMVSPAATWPGLTKPGRGELGEPEVYYPSGERNFARVLPADDIQGVVAASWMQELGASRIFLIHDGETYGKGLTDIVRAEANERGIQIVGYELLDKQATNYENLVGLVRRARPDLVYYGGVLENNFDLLLRDLYAGGYREKIMAPDGVYSDEALAHLGEATSNLYITFGGLPPEKLEGAGRRWYEEFTKSVNPSPDAFAPFSYEATSVILEAIERTCDKDRSAIRRALFAIRDFEGLLGTWSFDENGDTSLTTMSGLRYQDGRFQFVKLLSSN